MHLAEGLARRRQDPIRPFRLGIGSGPDWEASVYFASHLEPARKRATMPRLRILVLASCLAIAPAAFAQEVFPPVQVGGGGSSTRQANGQIVEASVTGPIVVEINYTEISSQRVTGTVRLLGPGQGSVRIRWVNRSREVMINLDPNNPNRAFGMEGGDVDKRGGEISPE